MIINPSKKNSLLFVPALVLFQSLDVLQPGVLEGLFCGDSAFCWRKYVHDEIFGLL